jgi:uncharacterized membrane protein
MGRTGPDHDGWYHRPGPPHAGAQRRGHQPAPLRTGRGLDRLVTFLDAVVAIAITLLVLPLIDVLTEGPQEPLGDLLTEHLAQFGSFLLSFVVIGRLWTAHHRLVERVGNYDPAFMQVNLVWALTIVVLPFSTQMIAVYSTQRLSVGLYIGTIAVSTTCLSVLSILVHRRPALRREGVAGADRGPLASVITTALVLLALVIGVAVPAVNFAALLLLLLTGPLVRVLGRPRRR